PAGAEQHRRPGGQRRAADGADNDLRQGQVAGGPYPEHDIMAVVLAADDLTGQASRPIRTGAATILVTAQFDLLGPDQDRDGAARSRPGGGVEWQAAQWSVGGVAIEEAGHQVGLADEAGHGRVGGPGV